MIGVRVCFLIQRCRIMVGSYVRVVGSIIVVHERDSRDCKCLSPATSTHKGLIVCKSGVNEMIYTSTESH